MLAQVRPNGTETERKYNSGVQVIERQTVELAFRLHGTEQKRHHFYGAYCIMHTSSLSWVERSSEGVRWFLLLLNPSPLTRVC